MPVDIIDGTIPPAQPQKYSGGGIVGGPNRNFKLPIPDLHPEATTFSAGEIVLEIDIQREQTYQKIEIDPFTGETNYKTEVVKSGNGMVVFQPLDQALRSRFDIRREQYANHKDVVSMDAMDGRGEGIALDVEKRIGRIVDLQDTEFGREEFAKLRRIAIHAEPMGWLLANPKPPQIFKLTESQVWTWLFAMRQLIDKGCGTKGVRMCRDVQNADAVPSKEKCIRSRKVRPAWILLDLEKLLLLDLEARAKRFGDTAERAALYDYDGSLTPALMGLDDDADFIKPCPTR